MSVFILNFIPCSNCACSLILFFLKNVAGETSFPRWLNADGTGSLDVKPEKGKVSFVMDHVHRDNQPCIFSMH